ncbi:hypothetical protein LAZ67_18001701 [Cordylochernes scorpioides]|uniref:Mos1 transposase HTH domain-containing protein n=1 Tax=Cordylochernes scorpioides TaxID=51811 RepID=A0ABY6LIJ9_9ARAC|nr:hypothetical protein LAZ67_18001701 [Cordylochernes scorpioides]
MTEVTCFAANTSFKFILGAVYIHPGASMQDIGMLLWQGLGPYIHNSQYVPPFVQVDSSIPILLCGWPDEIKRWNRFEWLKREEEEAATWHPSGWLFRESSAEQMPPDKKKKKKNSPLDGEIVWTVLKRVCIGFCFKLGKTASESFKILKQAFKEDALSQSRTFEWFARLKAEKARMIKSKLKCLLITLFVVKGLVHYELVPECQTINQHYYLDVLRRLREPVRQKRPEKWHQKNWLLHHDNARPHTAVTVPLYLTKHGIALLPQPPYSPDLLPTTFSFTLKLKES